MRLVSLTISLNRCGISRSAQLNVGVTPPLLLSIAPSIAEFLSNLFVCRTATCCRLTYRCWSTSFLSSSDRAACLWRSALRPIPCFSGSHNSVACSFLYRFRLSSCCISKKKALKKANLVLPLVDVAFTLLREEGGNSDGDVSDDESDEETSISSAHNVRYFLPLN